MTPNQNKSLTQKKPSASQQTLSVLMVDDDSEDILLTRRFFKDSRILVDFFALSDGEEALAFFKDPESMDAPIPMPGLILLDYLMPKVDCAELIEAIRSNHDFDRIPVIVLTSSMEDSEIFRKRLPGADLFLHKPVEFATFMTAVLRMHHFESSLLTSDEM